MAIWRKKPTITPANEYTEEPRTRAYYYRSNSYLTYNSQKEQENGNKRKTYEEGVSLKKSSMAIPDLNETIDSEEEEEVVMALPTKRMMRKEEDGYHQTLEERINELNKNIGRNWCEASLVLKGCKACHIYVMVSEIDEKCPKCSLATFLCDVAHPNKQRRLF